MSSYNLKSFLVIDGFELQTNGVAAIGEISTQSLTYAPNVERYQNGLNDKLSLYVFTSKLSTQGNITIPSECKTLVDQICSWVYTRFIGQNATQDSSTIAAELQLAFATQLAQVSIGSLIQNHTGQWFPTYVGFKLLGFAYDATIDIWLNDAKFQSQYDEYAVLNVCILDTPDSFFQAASTVISQVQAVNAKPAVWLNKINQAKQGPETFLTTIDVNYVNPLDDTQSILVTWPIIGYGIKANDTDVMRASLCNWILSNSTHSQNEWKQIMPDLFRNTEFIFLPRWRNAAISYMQLSAGIYSGLIKLTKELNYVKSLQLTGLTDAFVAEHLTSIASNYRSLQCLCIGNPDNKSSLFEIQQVFPDICDIPINSPDFARLPNYDTQVFLRMLNTALLHADTATRETIMLGDYRLVIRGALVFVSFSLNGIQYLVSTNTTTPNY